MNSIAPVSTPRRSAVDQVVEALLAGLIKQSFAPGQRLIEADLTAEYGVSRGTLREAFRRLAADGLIEIVPNRGAIVRRLTQRDLHELFQIRSELEGLAARLAANAMSDPETRARFTALVAPIWSDAPRVDAGQYLQENSDFHRAILVAADNRHLANVCSQFHLHAIMGQVGGALTAETMRQSVMEHRGLAEAIVAGDAALAEQRMRAHLSRAMKLSHF